MTTPYIQDSLMDIGLKAILEQIRLEALALASGEGGDTSQIEADLAALTAEVAALTATVTTQGTDLAAASAAATAAQAAADAATAAAAEATAAVAALRGTVVADLTALHTSATSSLAKLDLDATVTDADYAATCAPPALTTTA